MVLTDDYRKDLDLEELVELNKEDFMPFYGKDGWAKFVDGNLLMDYVDSGYVPIVRSKGYTYCVVGIQTVNALLQNVTATSTTVLQLSIRGQLL